EATKVPQAKSQRLQVQGRSERTSTRLKSLHHHSTPNDFLKQSIQAGVKEQSDEDDPDGNVGNELGKRGEIRSREPTPHDQRNRRDQNEAPGEPQIHALIAALLPPATAFT